MSLLLRIQFYKSHFLEIDEKEMDNVNKEVREWINMLNFRWRIISMNERHFHGYDMKKYIINFSKYEDKSLKNLWTCYPLLFCKLQKKNGSLYFPSRLSSFIFFIVCVCVFCKYVLMF
jgi:hypothetical protein